MFIKLSMKVFDDKDKELLVKDFKSTMNQFKRSSVLLPGLKGKAMYDLHKNWKVRINTPDGHIIYKIEETK